MLKLSWGKRAFKIFINQWRWEGDNVGSKAAETLRSNVAKALIKIQKMPTIGRFRKQSGDKTYRLISTHPKSALYYWHNDKEIRIVRFIIALRQK